MTPVSSAATAAPGGDLAAFVGKAVRDALDLGQQELPTLPDVALKIRMELRDERSDVASMARVIGQDPGIASSIIRVVNTPLLRTLVPIRDLQGAVSRLGLEGAANLGVSLALRQVFDAHCQYVRVQMNLLREHAVRVAGLAWALAHAHGRLPADQALLAGLTHSVGALPVLAWIDRHPDVVPQPQMDAVVESLQAQLGVRVLEAWGFPRARVPVTFRDAHCDGKPTVADAVGAAWLLARDTGCAVDGVPEPVAGLGISEDMLARCLEGAAQVTGTLSRR